MKVVSLIASFLLLTINCFGNNSAQGWSYKYEVDAPGKRSESVHGDLFYKNRELPEEFGQVITPIGEFIFVNGPSLSSNQKVKWVPFGQRPGDSQGIMNFARRREDVEGFFSGKYPGFRKTTSKEMPPSVSTEPYLEGTFEKPPNGVGADWFYAVKPGFWIDPQKIDQALKALAGK